MRAVRLALALVAALASSALAQDTRPAAPAAKVAPDPLGPLKAEMAEQDRLADAGKAEQAVAAARERVKDGTPESWYLLGRALGTAAVNGLVRQKDPASPGKGDQPIDKLLEATKHEEAMRRLDEAAAAFDKSLEAGGLTYAPAHLGRARVARKRWEIGLRRASLREKKDRGPFLEEAWRDLDQAITEYRAALQIAKAWKEPSLELAEALWEKDLPGDAEYVLYQFLTARPDDTDARMRLGMLKAQRKRYAEAEPEFRAVLLADPGDRVARKCLAQDLMCQDKFAECAEHWEVVRKQNPRDDEPYIKLFHVYLKLNKKDEAVGVLQDLVREMPGSEAARRGQAILDAVKKDPTALDAEALDPDSPEALVERLKSTDPLVVQRALERMRSFRWPDLPGEVYRLLVRQDDGTDEKLKAVHTAQRLAAVRLILDLGDPQTLTILEILLAHPRERERDEAVREEVAHAISGLPSDAIVPVLFETLDDPDPDIREWAVQGIAARTGKYFRHDLAVRSTAETWPGELASLRKWWASSSASESRRSACAALAAIYGRVEKGSKSRVARYSLPALDDASEAAFTAGYDLFRMLTAETLGWKGKPANAEERKRFAADARSWLEQQAQAKGGR